MANGYITRTIETARAFAWVVNGTNEDGSPRMEKVGDVEFRSTKASKREAYQALKSAGIKVNSQFVGFDVVSSDCVCQDLDTFIQHGVVVNRSENGKVDVPEV